MKFGAAIPNSREGKVYPSGFVTPELLAEVAVLAEDGGFYSLWANDLQSTFDEQLSDEDHVAPNFFEALTTLAYLAAKTSRIKFLTSAITVPLREPVLLAKQAATLDVLSGGRFLMGLGIGGKRTELDRLRGRTSKLINRGQWLDETLELMSALFTQQSVIHDGEYFSVHGAEVYPKPIQNPLPIYMTGGSDEMLRRTAKYGQGWIHMHISPDELVQRIEALNTSCANVNRDASEIDVSIQFEVLMARTKEIAMERWESSLSAKLSAARGRSAETSFLIGTPADITDRLKRYEDAGMTHVGLIFSAGTEPELLEQISLAGEMVIPSFEKSTD